MLKSADLASIYYTMGKCLLLPDFQSVVAYEQAYPSLRQKNITLFLTPTVSKRDGVTNPCWSFVHHHHAARYV